MIDLTNIDTESLLRLREQSLEQANRTQFGKQKDIKDILKTASMYFDYLVFRDFR